MGFSTATIGTAFALVFPAELPDKTMVAARSGSPQSVGVGAWAGCSGRGGVFAVLALFAAVQAI